MKIGIIGAGQIGSALIRQYTKTGHQVKMANASGVEKLKPLENETTAKAVTLDEVTRDIDVLVISIPFVEIPGLAGKIAPGISDHTVIIDTTNYYPIRDGHIEDIEKGMAESVWVSRHLSRPVVKAYNSILAGSLIEAGLPNDSPLRIALPVSGDDKQAKKIVASLVNDSGFDALDIGNLSDSWKQQPGSPVYCTDLTLTRLKRNLREVPKEVLPERRELALQFILEQNPSNWLDWRKDCVENNRMVYQTDLR
ncbi:NAD(P)-binding domain-containing protein [Sinomicrobium kalidii]|nr:NAD(P)-binding domain-containing protein [Sinomicrobium kalidii]UGU16141.1 NAD(P)-binding domain-containing protein [Sinomicrobium kalidii]